jgi:nitrite reductase (NADH) small subunit/3-phenylpropionate/trans-cinnamate dioxygenase ferredoxin subunit
MLAPMSDAPGMPPVREDSPAGTARWIEAGRVADLPRDGSGRTVELAGHCIALFWDAGRVHALDDRCPHQGASLGMGIALDGDVTCPWHGWHFRLADGCSTDGLDARVARHPVRVDAAGRIEVRLPAGPDS